MHEPFAQHLDHKGGGGGREGQRHGVAPPGEPPESGAGHRGQQHHRPQGAGDDRRDPARVAIGGVLPAHHPRVDRVNRVACQTSAARRLPAKEGQRRRRGRPTARRAPAPG